MPTSTLGKEVVPEGDLPEERSRDSSCWDPHTAARTRVGVGEDKGPPLLPQETGREQVLWAQRRLWDGF